MKTAEKVEPSSVIEKALSGERLDLAEGIELYRTDLHELGEAAFEFRNQRNDPKTVTFVIDRNISYTNACVSDCDFCAFSRPVGSSEAFILPKEQILEKIGELVRLSGTQVMIQGGLNPEIPFQYFLDLLRAIRSKYPTITIHSFSPTEVDFFARQEGKTVRQILTVLKEAGLESMPGGGGEILVERVREMISPKKLSAARWLEIQRTAHEIGFKTTATMVFGHVETIEERIVHLLQIRALQDETRGFRAFIPWTMSTPHTKLSNLSPIGGEDYLRTVAVSRLMLDNVPHIQSGWVTEGEKLAQMALFFGADDMGGILMEESVVSKTGLSHQMNIESLKRLIRQAGFHPAQRNTRYEILKST